jgi:sterol desaturase/sphingolipid hydroxylase (fatty acid hydroxylase superfamily)
MITVANSLLAFGIFFLVFLPLERLFAAHQQKVFRREYGTDVMFFFGQYLLWTAFVVYLLTLFAAGLNYLPLGEFRAAVAEQPIWLQVASAIILCDVCIYWAHRLSHKYEFLWRFHRVHHTSEHLDWVAAYREHPLDNLYTRLIENLPALLLGVRLEVIAGFVVFRGLWGLFIHSNTNIPLGPFKYILGSPKLHHWHHEIGHSGKCNFANLMPIMDVIFGTYHEPEEMPETYGVPDEISHNYFAQLAEPFRPNPKS